jgi:hypothetical protein
VRDPLNWQTWGNDWCSRVGREAPFTATTSPWRCQVVAEDFRDATTAEVLAMVSEHEPTVFDSGCEDLSVLRAELERVHRAWATPSR